MEFLNGLLSNFFTDMTSGDSMWFLLFIALFFLLGLLLGWIFWGRAIGLLRAELTSLRKSLSNANSDNARLKEAIELKEADLQKLQLELDSYRGRYEEMKAENGQIQSELIVSKGNFEKAQGQYKLATTNLTTSQEANEGLRAKVNTINTSIDNANKRIADLEAALAKCQAESKSLLETKSKGDKALLDLGILNGKYSGLTSEISGFKAKLNASNSENEELNASLLALQNTYGSVQNESANLQSRYDTNIALIDELKGKLSSLENDSSNLKQSNSDLNAQVLELQEDHEHSLEEIDRLKNRIGGFVDDSEKSTALSASYDDAKNAMDSMHEQMDSLKGENTRLESELNGTLGKLNLSGKELEDVNKHKEDLELQLAQLRTELDAAKSTNASLDAKLSEAAIEVEKQELTKEQKADSAKAELKSAFGSKIDIASESDKDDLKRISGVGPFIENKLNDIDIYTFKQISQFDDKLVQLVTDSIQFFPGRIQRDDWVGQAAKLMHQPDTRNHPHAAFLKYKNDNLKIVEGIGPKIEQLLKGGGINTWAELSKSEIQRLQEILNEGGDRFNLARPDTWPRQAELADAGKWDDLQEYQDFLIGGIDSSK